MGSTVSKSPPAPKRPVTWEVGGTWDEHWTIKQVLQPPFGPGARVGVRGVFVIENAGTELILKICDRSETILLSHHLLAKHVLNESKHMPHVFRCGDCSLEEGTGFIEMEQLHGCMGHPESAVLVVLSATCVQATAALRYCHKAGYLHYDVAPANLGVTKDHRVQLLDVGHFVDLNVTGSVLRPSRSAFCSMFQHQVLGSILHPLDDLESLMYSLLHIALVAAGKQLPWYEDGLQADRLYMKEHYAEAEALDQKVLAAKQRLVDDLRDSVEPFSCLPEAQRGVFLEVFCWLSSFDRRKASSFTDADYDAFVSLAKGL